MENRKLQLDGCFNARDLGGLSTIDGGRTKFRAVVRSDTLDYLSPRGWASLQDYGIRTIIDLRNDQEVNTESSTRPSEIKNIRIPVDRGLHSGEDDDFWSYWKQGAHLATPMYYRAHLDRFPTVSASVVTAIAQAVPGGVLFHCASGRDRTGLIAMLLLALSGVAVDEIIADYIVSAESLGPLYARKGIEDEGPKIAAFVKTAGLSFDMIIRDTLATINVIEQLRRGGVAEKDLAAARNRLRI